MFFFFFFLYSGKTFFLLGGHFHSISPIPLSLFPTSHNTPPSHCFGKGTKVLLPNGMSKNIEDLEAEQYVLDYTGMPRKIVGIIRGKCDVLHEVTVIGKRWGLGKHTPKDPEALGSSKKRPSSQDEDEISTDNSDDEEFGDDDLVDSQGHALIPESVWQPTRFICTPQHKLVLANTKLQHVSPPGLSPDFKTKKLKEKEEDTNNNASGSSGSSSNSGSNNNSKLEEAIDDHDGSYCVRFPKLMEDGSLGSGSQSFTWKTGHSFRGEAAQEEAKQAAKDLLAKLQALGCTGQSYNATKEGVYKVSISNWGLDKEKLKASIKSQTFRYATSTKYNNTHSDRVYPTKQEAMEAANLFYEQQRQTSQQTFWNATITQYQQTSKKGFTMFRAAGVEKFPEPSHLDLHSLINEAYTQAKLNEISIEERLTLQEFGYLLGLYLADSSFKTFIFFIGPDEKELVDYLELVAEKLKLLVDIKPPGDDRACYHIHLSASPGYGNVLRKLFKLIGIDFSNHKYLSDDLIQLLVGQPASFRNAFLAGCIDGDGCLDLDKRTDCFHYKFGQNVINKESPRVAVNHDRIILCFRQIARSLGFRCESYRFIRESRQVTIVNNSASMPTSITHQLPEAHEVNAYLSGDPNRLVQLPFQLKKKIVDRELICKKSRNRKYLPFMVKEVEGGQYFGIELETIPNVHPYFLLEDFLVVHDSKL